MAVLKRNPDTLSYLVVRKAYTDERGDFHQGETIWQGEIRCDAVSNSQAKSIKFPDGTKYEYSYEVHLPHDVREFQVGEKVRIQFFDESIKEFKVQGFQRFQKQAKIWL